MNRSLWRWIPTAFLSAVLVALALLTRGFTALPSTYYMTGPSMEPSGSQGAWFLARPLRDMLGWPDSRFLGAVPRERIEERYLFGLW